MIPQGKRDTFNAKKRKISVPFHGRANFRFTSFACAWSSCFLSANDDEGLREPPPPPPVALPPLPRRPGPSTPPPGAAAPLPLVLARGLPARGERASGCKVRDARRADDDDDDDDDDAEVGLKKFPMAPKLLPMLLPKGEVNALPSPLPSPSLSPSPPTLSFSPFLLSAPSALGAAVASLALPNPKENEGTEPVMVDRRADTGVRFAG